MRRCSWRLLLSHVTYGLLLAGFPTDTTARAPNETGRTTADLFVAVNGSDQWSGQLAQPNQARTDGPFATLARARDAVRALKQRRDKQEILVLIRGGVYRLDETVVFSIEDSAPAGGTITYAAYGREIPVFTSAVPIVGWRKPEHPSPLLPEIARNRVWTADVPPRLSNVLTLYEASHRLLSSVVKTICARGVRQRDDPAERDSISPGAMKNWPDVQNGELRVIPSCDYEMCLLSLAEVDEKAGLAKTTAPASRTMGRVKFMDETAWVENILEVLDQPGEWVFSAADRKLYLWPTGDEPSETINAPMLTELIRVEGRIDYDGPADVPVTGLVFQGYPSPVASAGPGMGPQKGNCSTSGSTSIRPRR